MLSLNVIIPIYNAAKTLAGLLRSCPKLPEVSYLFVDGGSSDGTLEMLDQSDVISAPRSTLIGAENIGISATTGDWVYFIGADDQLNPPAVPDLLVQLGTMPTEIETAWVKVAEHIPGFGGLEGPPWRYTYRQQSLVFRRRVFDRDGLFEAGGTDYTNQLTNELRGRDSALQLDIRLAWVSLGGRSARLSKANQMFISTPAQSRGPQQPIGK